MNEISERETSLIHLLNSLENIEEVSRLKGSEIHLIRAPGRINLIGGHTDYNEGYVLPCTISMDVYVAACLNETRFIVVNSSELGQIQIFNLDNFEKTNNWIDYIKGVVHYLLTSGNQFGGFMAACNSNIPIGSGLSSSAAFEVAFTQTINSIFNLKLDKKTIANISYLAETKYMAISCGIMDQFISSCGLKNHVMFLDCRPPYDNEFLLIPLDDDLKLIILDSNITHSVKSFINLRKEECMRGLKILQKSLKDKQALRDIKIEELNKYQNRITPANIRNRVKHVVNENQRVLEAKEALKEQNLEKLGELMYQSHLSLDKYYDVSCAELNYIFNFLRKKSQTIGVRMTGAGKGGSLVAILKNKNLDTLFKEISKAYYNQFNLELKSYTCSIPNGAETIKKINYY